MCAGTVEERSIVESVRAVLGGKGKFFEAQCTDILPQEKAIVACFPGGWPCWPGVVGRRAGVVGRQVGVAGGRAGEVCGRAGAVWCLVCRAWQRAPGGGVEAEQRQVDGQRLEVWRSGRRTALPAWLAGAPLAALPRPPACLPGCRGCRLP